MYLLISATTVLICLFSSVSTAFCAEAGVAVSMPAETSNVKGSRGGMCYCNFCLPRSQIMLSAGYYATEQIKPHIETPQDCNLTWFELSTLGRIAGPVAAIYFGVGAGWYIPKVSHYQPPERSWSVYEWYKYDNTSRAHVRCGLELRVTNYLFVMADLKYIIRPVAIDAFPAHGSPYSIELGTLFLSIGAMLSLQ